MNEWAYCGVYDDSICSWGGRADVNRETAAAGPKGGAERDAGLAEGGAGSCRDDWGREVNGR